MKKIMSSLIGFTFLSSVALAQAGMQGGAGTQGSVGGAATGTYQGGVGAPTTQAPQGSVNAPTTGSPSTFTTPNPNITSGTVNTDSLQQGSGAVNQGGVYETIPYGSGARPYGNSQGPASNPWAGQVQVPQNGQVQAPAGGQVDPYEGAVNPNINQGNTQSAPASGTVTGR